MTTGKKTAKDTTKAEATSTTEGTAAQSAGDSAAATNAATGTTTAPTADQGATQKAAEQDTGTTQDAGAGAGQQDAATTTTAVETAAAAPLVLALGVSQSDNADALAELLQQAEFPLKLQVVNQMPRPVSFPDLQNLFLGHVAGKPESKTGTAVFRDVDQLHRFATDVQGLCEFNGFKHGVQLTTL